MLNSLTIFLCFVGFLVFGYLSILRLLVTREFGGFSASSLAESIRDRRVLTSLGSSAFFVSMPATSLLLFWGWGPAILWLIVFHLFVESLFHLQYTTTEQDHSLAELLVRSNVSREAPGLALLESTLVQSFFILLMATVVSLIATLIDKQSGLLFALLALFPAQQLLRNSNASVPFSLSALSSILVIGVGVLFAHKLGFGIYGNWAIFGDSLWGGALSWLRINNVTLIAALLIINSFLLADKSQFQEDIATLAGGFVVLLIIIMEIRLGVLKPILDAPLNAVQSTDSTNTIPTFISISLFSFAGLGALLIRLLNDETNYADAKTSAICFGRLQIESVVQLLFLIVLVLSLACALGIGAWKTHYTEWVSDSSFTDHLNLSITGILQLVHSSVKTGTFAHTLIMVGMCIAGVSFLMMCVSRFKITRHDKGEDKNLFDVIVSNKIPQAIIIFILSIYFTEVGISVIIWLLVGMLSWALVVHLMLAITQDMHEPSSARLIYGSLSLGLVALGTLQTVWVTVTWVLEGHFIAAGAAITLILIVAALWWRSIIVIAKRFSKSPDGALFGND